MIKVLFFLESLAGGGAEKVLTDIVSNIDDKKYDITVCTVTDEGIYQEQVNKACKYYSFLHMRNYRAGGLKKILFWLGIKLIYNLPVSILYRLLVKERYDVEVAFIEGFATKFIAASNNADSKKIAWVHTDMKKNGYADSCYRDINEHIATYKRYNKIVCVSQSVKRVFEQKFYTSEQISVQYNPVDEEAVIEKAQEEIEFQEWKRPLLVTVGRLEESKGYRRLLKCVKKLKEELFQFELWIIGEGSQRYEMQSFIEDNNLKDVVKILGFQNNPYKYLNRCDAFICSSYAEGFSTAATESLILQKAIFTVECAGMKELFANECCGEIVSNSDDALYIILKKIVSGQWSVNDYSEGLKNRAKEFQISSRIKEIEKLLEK